MMPVNRPMHPGRTMVSAYRRPARWWIGAGVFLMLSGIPATAGDMEDYLRNELKGCRAVLRSNVMRVDYRPTYDQFDELLAEVPVGTWVNEDGTIHNIVAEPGSGIRDLKTQFLEGDEIRIVGLTSNRRATQLVLSLAANPDIRSRLELRYSGSLRKDLSDVNRVWTVLGKVMEWSPATNGVGICRKDPSEAERSGSSYETPAGEPGGGNESSGHPGGPFGPANEEE